MIRNSYYDVFVNLFENDKSIKRFYVYLARVTWLHLFFASLVPFFIFIVHVINEFHTRCIPLSFMVERLAWFSYKLDEQLSNHE